MVQKRPPKPKAKPSYLEWHGGNLRVTVAVPLNVQAVIGATRLKQSLDTDSVTVAEVLKRPHVQRFHQMIDEARKGRRIDPVVREALTLAKARRSASSASERADIDVLIAEQAYKLAGPPVDEVGLTDGSRHPIYEPQREQEADNYAALARGEAIPLDLHYQTYSDHLTTKARTKADDARAVAYLLTWCAKNEVRPNIHEISKQRARLFIDALPALANGIGPATVQKYLNRLACYWKWLEEREYAAVNVWRGVTIAKPLVMDDEKGRPFTDDEMRTLLEGPAPDHMQVLMRIGALSGARLDAIVCLTVGDCAGGTFRFKPQKKETGYRFVPIHSALKEIIAKRTKGKAADTDLFPEWPAPKKDDSPREKSFKASNAFTAYRRSVGVNEVVPGQRRSLVVFHSFRKWFITKAEQSNQPESIIASVVGHKRKGMTLGVYSAGPSAAQFRKCVEAVKLPPPPLPVAKITKKGKPNGL